MPCPICHDPDERPDLPDGWRSIASTTDGDATPPSIQASDESERRVQKLIAQLRPRLTAALRKQMRIV
jgi:hypothetical protein